MGRYYLIVISPNQKRFVPGRQITCNILIYQEVLHTMHTKKVCKRIMTIKMDLKKAYDMLSWRFIRDTLECINLPENWV